MGSQAHPGPLAAGQLLQCVPTSMQRGVAGVLGQRDLLDVAYSLGQALPASVAQTSFPGCLSLGSGRESTH